ncbi:hypothetical protein ACOMHN_038364 [Nucella lapillus]
MGGQPSDAPALSPPSPLQQGGQSSNAPALSPPSPLPQGSQPIALALSPSSPLPQDGQPSDAPGLSPSSSTLLLYPSDSTLSICHLNSQSAVKTGLDPTLCGPLLALPLTSTTIGLWDLSHPPSSHPLQLTGHKRTLSALAFSHHDDEPRLLCSAAQDHLMVWNVSACLHNNNNAAAQGLEPRGEVILPHPGDVTHVSFSPDAGRVAACEGPVVKVVSVARSRVEAELSGHAARVSAAEFCPHYSATLVTISDDRTVAVWDVKLPSLLYQSCVLCAAPLLSLAMNPAEPQVAVASASGDIQVFDLADGKNFRQLARMDVSKMLTKFRQGRQSPSPSPPSGDGPVVVTRGGVSRKGEGDPPPQGGDEGGGCSSFSIIESSHSVLSLLYVGAHCDKGTSSFQGKGRSSQPEDLRSMDKLGSSSHAHAAMGEVLCASSPVLVVVSAHCALQVDSRTLEVLALLDFQQPIPTITTPGGGSGVTLQGVGVAGAGRVSDRQVVVVAGTLFDSRTHCLQWGVVGASGGTAGTGGVVESALVDDLKLSPSMGDNDDDDNESPDELNMVATRPLTHNSPLRSEFVAANNTTTPGIHPASKRGSVGGRPGKKADPMNQPLTFKTKVKSSGYTAAPRTTMFQPKTNARGRPAVDTPKGRGQSLAVKLSSQEYPQDAGPPAELDSRLTAGATVTDLKFSSSGQHLACCLANKTSLVFPAPFGQKDGSAFIGHDGCINSVRWSNSGKYLLTSSNDKTAILWDRASGESLLAFNSMQANSKEKPERGKEGCGKEVKGAQFCYMDKFVLIIAGNQLRLYKYLIDSAASKDEVRRYLSKGKSKLVKSWQSPGQSLTALSAVNAFYSHLAACAVSNRNLEIYDLNEGRLAHVFNNAHTKPAQAMALNEGSPFTSQPQEAFNVFATSATLDCVKLWDVRSRRCVLRLQGHANQAHGCGIAFSACGTYLASGSEDKVAYVYDLRQGTFCQRLRGHTEVVSSVTFHPARPLLATAAIDGKVLLFKA